MRYDFCICSFKNNPFAETAKPSPFGNLASILSSSGFAGSGPNGGIKTPLTTFSFGTPTPKLKEWSAQGGISYNAAFASWYLRQT